MLRIFKGIIFGHYMPLDSPVHKLDPRTKLVITLFISISVFLLSDVPGYLVFGVAVIFATLLSKLRLSIVLRTIRPLLWIMLFSFVLNALFTPGNAIYHLGPLAISREGVVNGIQMVVRLSILMAASGLLTLTTSPIALTDGIERLLMPLTPLGFPAHELAMMMSIALRFVPTLAEEASKITAAQVSRGADFSSGGVTKRAKNLIALLVPLFVSSFRRADELAMAMESRLYRGGKGRSRLRDLKFTFADVVACLIVVPVGIYAVVFH